MSDSNNPLISNAAMNGNALMPSAAPPAPVTPPMDTGRHDYRAIVHANIAQAMSGFDQDTMIRKRDAAGGEMEKLIEVMNNPNPQRREIVDYIHGLARSGQITPQEATGVLQSLPTDPEDIHHWAKAMFATVMHAGIHAHAAFPEELFPGAQAAQPPAPAEETPQAEQPQEAEQP